MTPTSSPTSTEPLAAAAARPDMVIHGRARLPMAMAAVMGVVGLLQLAGTAAALGPVFTGAFTGVAIAGAAVGLAGAGLCLWLAWAVLSVPRPVLIFRADRLEVGRFFGKYATVTYAEMAGQDGTTAATGAAGKAARRLRELSIPSWAMTVGENRLWQAELAARAPWLAAGGIQG